MMNFSIRATVPPDFDITKHQVTRFKRVNYKGEYVCQPDGYFQYNQHSAETSIHYSEGALLALSDLEVVEYIPRNL